MAKCEKCGYELEESFNYCPNCGEPVTELAKEREVLKLQNAGLVMIGQLLKSTDNLEAKKVIKQFLDDFNK